jgi:hypothetical protein
MQSSDGGNQIKSMIRIETVQYGLKPFDTVFR